MPDDQIENLLKIIRLASFVKIANVVCIQRLCEAIHFETSLRCSAVLPSLFNSDCSYIPLMPSGRDFRSRALTKNI
ncbi:hypothetical protein PT2222_280008 [Paraburkholderia tropica]